MGRINRVALYAMAPFIFMRVFSGWFGIVICAFGVYIVSLFHKKGTPYKGLEYTLIR